MTRAVRGALAFVLVFSLATSAAWAQLNTAELNGQVTDNTGGVLPGVTVTVSQTETGLQRTVVTDGSGAYVMTALPTGPYELEVALQGFRTYLQTGLVLTVGATPTVNVELELGALEETITVEAAAPIVDVRSAGISAVVENEQILELPLQGRQVTDLIVLAGAAVQTGDAGGRHVQGGVRISVAGGLPTGIGYSLDGSSHNSRQSNMNLPLPFPDALQEFRVATSAVSAESGSKSGAAVNAVTKSGTNRFSGNAFEFLRDSRFNAPEHFAAFGPDGEQLGDGLKRHQYGFTVGGPIVENKLFFFGGYQGTPVRVEPTSQIMNVPTAAMLAGDFTTYASRACQGRRAITLGAPYVNNRIDPALLSPAAVNLAAELPEPSDECGTVQFSVTRDEDTYQPITRFDYQASNNHSFFVRYMFMKVVTPEGYTGPGDNILKAGPGVGGANRSHMTSIGETSVLNSTVVNSVRVGLNYSWVERSHQPTPDPSSIGVNITTQLPGQFPLDVDGEFEISRGGGHQRDSREPHLCVYRRPDVPEGEPPVQHRRERGVVVARVQFHLAVERQLDLRRPAYRDGNIGPDGGPGVQHGAGRLRLPPRGQLVHWGLRAGLLAPLGPRDAQLRPALGTVSRPERPERRGRRLRSGALR